MDQITQDRLNLLEQNIRDCTEDIAKKLEKTGSQQDVIELTQQIKLIFESLTLANEKREVHSSKIDELTKMIIDTSNALIEHMKDEELAYGILQSSVKEIAKITQQQQSKIEQTHRSIEKLFTIVDEQREESRGFDKKIDKYDTYFKIGFWIFGSLMTGIAGMLFKLLWEGVK